MDETSDTVANYAVAACPSELLGRPVGELFYALVNRRVGQAVWQRIILERLMWEGR